VKSGSLPRVNKSKISDLVYETLREKIVSQELVPAQRLDLDAFEKQLGVSRTPLKEALHRLEVEGLVEIFPQSGTYVTNLSAEDIAESFEVRRLIEVYAVELAVQRVSDEVIKRLKKIVKELGKLAVVKDRNAIYPHYLILDHEFHRQLVALACNRRLSRAHDRENVHAQMARIRYRRSERELDTAQHEHERILAALEARKAESAKAELDAHLKRANQSILADMKREPNAGPPDSQTKRIQGQSDVARDPGLGRRHNLDNARARI
jgi:DNA-binding GntR family transcriptional regulator